jgi:hypothetical protein
MVRHCRTVAATTVTVFAGISKMPQPHDRPKGGRSVGARICFGVLGLVAVSALVGFQVDVSFIPGGNFLLGLLVLGVVHIAVGRFSGLP